MSVIPPTSALSSRSAQSKVTNDGKGAGPRRAVALGQRNRRPDRRGKQVVLVSSGAIAEGLQRLGWATRPKAVHELQAAAAVGQMGLVQAYETAFRAEGLKPPRCCSPTKTWPTAPAI